jgi:hypothetical protein
LLGKRAPISLRVNPDVDAKTHPYISTGLKDNKFGIAYDEALRVYRAGRGAATSAVVGIDCHIGSQLTEIAPFGEALDKVLSLVEQIEAAGITLEHIDMGGGVGIRYRDELPPDLADYARTLLDSAGRPRTDCTSSRAAPWSAMPAAAYPRGIPEARQKQGLRHRRCRHERPDAPGALRRLARHPAGDAARYRARGTTKSSARSARAAIFSAMIAPWPRRRRPAGHPVCRRLWHEHELQLQHPDACCGSAGAIHADRYGPAQLYENESAEVHGAKE